MQTITNVNNYPSSYNNSTLSTKLPFVYQGMRLSPLCWNILYEIYLITLTNKRDYGYTAQEISDRFKAKGRKGVCRANIEDAIQTLQSILFFVRKTTRKNPPIWGKEKFRGCYRELTEMGLEFIKYRLAERNRLKKEKLDNKTRELNRELITSQPYCHVASGPPSKIKIKEERSNLDSKSYIHSSARSDFSNSCFEEYAAMESNAPPYIEQEALQETIYEPVLPKYRKVTKTLLDASGLENGNKINVINAIYRQQNCNSPIKSFPGLVKSFIATERVSKPRYQTSIKQPFVFVEMTEEEKIKSREAGLKAFAEMKKYNLNS